MPYCSGYCASRFLARIVAERAGLGARLSTSHSDPHRCRTAQLCFRSQPHVVGWTLIGVSPERGSPLRPNTLASAADHHTVNVPTSDCSPLRIHIRRCWTPAGAAGAASGECIRTAVENSSAGHCRQSTIRWPLRPGGGQPGVGSVAGFRHDQAAPDQFVARDAVDAVLGVLHGVQQVRQEPVHAHRAAH
jgi:hypothetical protein